MKLFKKKKSETNGELKSKNVVIFNACSNDVSELSLGIANELRRIEKANAIIVEFPCLGIPRLGLTLEQQDYDKNKSIDQLLMDYERDDLKSLRDYIVRNGDIDMIPIHVRNRPDLPTMLKLERTQTLLDVPYVLKKGLQEDYTYVIYTLQGQMIHPMTLTALKHADLVVMTVNQTKDLAWTYGIYKRLIEDYGLNSDQIRVYMPNKQFDFPDVKISTKLSELTQYIRESSVYKRADDITRHTVIETSKSHIGIINPLEHVSYKVTTHHLSAEISMSDMEKMKDLIDRCRSYLRDQHNDEFVRQIIEEDARNKIRYYIADFIKEQTDLIFDMELHDVIHIVQREITEMGVLQPALDDPMITSIEINSPDETIVEYNGKPKHDKSIKFDSVEHIYQVISKMLLPIGKTLTANEPVIDSNYRGFRICVTLDTTRGGVSARSPIISIRKFPPKVYSDVSCISYGNINEDIVDFFRDIYTYGPNTMICGGTNSGKTAQLIRIPLYLDPLTRILTIEDSEEMMLKSKEDYVHYPNIASFLVKEHENKARRYNIARLVKTSLRQNPDWIIVGEVRDEEAALQALESANTGHSVALTLHSNGAKEGAVRFVQLCGNTVTAASQVATCIDLIIYQKNVNGVRIVTEISELMGYKGAEEPLLNPIFKYNFSTNNHERVGGLINLKNKLLEKGAADSVIQRWCIA